MNCWHSCSKQTGEILRSHGLKQIHGEVCSWGENGNHWFLKPQCSGGDLCFTSILLRIFISMLIKNISLYFPLVPLSEFGTKMTLVSKCSFHFYFIGNIGDDLFCKDLVECGSACWLTLGFCSLRDSLSLLQYHCFL